MRSAELTHFQKSFVLRNYKKTAMKQMARSLKIPYSRIQRYMAHNHLESQHPRSRTKQRLGSRGCFDWADYKHGIIANDSI